MLLLIAWGQLTMRLDELESFGDVVLAISHHSDERGVGWATPRVRVVSLARERHGGDERKRGRRAVAGWFSRRSGGKVAIRKSREEGGEEDLRRGGQAERREAT